MTPHRIIAALFAVIVATLPAFAASPATVGELLDAGGKRLSRVDIQRLFAGAKIQGSAMGSPDSTFLLSYGADGTATGEGRFPGGATAITGTWSANERDQYCQSLRTASGTPIQGCFYYFVIGDRLFAAPTDSRAAPLYERRLTR